MRRKYGTMGQELVSIVIPVYNAEAYLGECLASIVGQTYQNLEILIVDDGSSDSSFKIYSRYLEKDRRVRAIRKKNEGVSKARNMGIDSSRGKYLLFVDADDYIDKAFVGRLVENVENADIAICGYSRVHKEEKAVVYRESGVVPREELFTHTFCSNLIGGTCWNKIFRAEIIEQNGIRFDEAIAIGEDMLFLAEYYKVCRRAVYIGEALYDYRCNPGSALQQSYQKRRFDVRNISCLDAAEKFGKLYEDGTEGMQECVAYRKVRSSLWLLYQMIICKHHDKDTLGRMQRTIRHDYGKYRKSSYGTKLEKATAIGMCMNPRMVYYIGTIAIPCFRDRMDKYLT